MKFSIATLLLPVLALASPIVERDDVSIIAALKTVQDKITTLNTTVTSFTKDKDAITALKIQFQSDDLTKALTAADGAVNASAQLTDAQSGNVAVAVINLSTASQSLLKNLVSKKPQFKTAVLGFSAFGLVKSGLVKSKAAADQFGKDLTGKISAIYKSSAPVIQKQIDDAFDSAIAQFS